jgi:cell division septation protein DedD
MNHAKNTNGNGVGTASGNSSRPRPSFEVKVDRATRELHVSATRAVAGVSLAGFCGLLIGVVAVTRNVTDSGPQRARADAMPLSPARVTPVSIIPPEDLPPQLGLLQGQPVVVPEHKAAPRPAPAAVVPTTQPAKSQATVAAPKPEAVKDGHVVGFTYLVYGSYRTEEEAKSELKRLKKKGVACSIEQTLPGYTKPGWYSLVDVKGYRSAQDKGYRKLVQALAEKGIEPQPYRWRNPAADGEAAEDE